MVKYSIQRKWSSSFKLKTKLYNNNKKKPWRDSSEIKLMVCFSYDDQASLITEYIFYTANETGSSSH